MPMNTQLYTVPEAAEILGISHEAVRARLKRGTLLREDIEGKVYVRLAAGLDERPDKTDKSPADQPTDQLADQLPVQAEGPLVESLYERIEDLKSQIERMSREAERRDTIMLHLSQSFAQTKDSEAPKELPESTRKEETQQPSWWRRLGARLGARLFGF